MKYVAIIVAMVAGITGYYIGSFRGKSAIEELASVKEAAKQEKAESDKTITALKESIAGLAAEHKSELDKLETQYKQQRAKLDETLAHKEKKISDMAARMNANGQETSRLRLNAGSATDPAEKQKLHERVAQLESEKRNLASNVAGLKCLSAAVPDEILGQMQRAQP